MNKKEMAAKLAEKAEISQVQATAILNALFDMKGRSLSETVMSIPVTDRAYVQRRTFGTAWRGGTPIRERLEA